VLAAALALAGCDPGPRDAAATRFVAGATAPPATLPDDIVRGLGTDASVLDCAGGVVAGHSAFAPDWVVAHRIDLDEDGRDDWLVEGRHRCLAGREGAGWWLYADGPEGRRLLLAAGRARALELLPDRSHGFHDLRLTRAPGDVALVRYDGAAYVVSPTGVD
jgi:hypothetical protein